MRVVRGGYEGRVLDGTEDVKVRESADDAEKDDGFDGSISRMQREWPQESFHDDISSRRTQQWNGVFWDARWTGQLEVEFKAHVRPLEVLKGQSWALRESESRCQQLGPETINQ